MKPSASTAVIVSRARSRGIGAWRRNSPLTGVDHGGALVADHRIRDPGRRSVGPDRLEHPAGHDQHPDPCRTGGGDRRLRPLAQAQVLGDERPVEVAREDLDVEREVVGEDQPEVDSTTYAVTSAICCSES